MGEGSRDNTREEMKDENSKEINMTTLVVCKNKIERQGDPKRKKEAKSGADYDCVNWTKAFDKEVTKLM